jgi:hypothetical protein
LLNRPHSFVDRYDIFHFGQAIFAHKEKVEAAALADAENVLTVYRDARGADHYRHFERVASIEDVTTPPQRDWEWDSSVVRFPEDRRFPPVLAEASHEYLLGLPDERASMERLDAVYSGLLAGLSKPGTEVALRGVEGAVEQISQMLNSASLRALLVGVVEVGERDAALAKFGAGENLWVAAPLVEHLEHASLAELAALAVLRALFVDASDSDAAHHEKELHTLEELMLDRLLAAAESDLIEVKRCACALMGSELVARHAEQRLAFSYVLGRLMDSDETAVADASARALAALALRRVSPPVSLARQGTATVSPKLTTLSPDDTSMLTEEILGIYSLPHEHRKPVATMLATLLTSDAREDTKT